MNHKVLHKRSAVITEQNEPKMPSPDIFEYGEIGVNYAKGVETIITKNSDGEIVQFKSKNYIDNSIENNSKTLMDNINKIIEDNTASIMEDVADADDVLKIALEGEIDAAVQKLMTNTSLSFFCIEPVSVVINGETTVYPANSLVNTMLMDTDEFEVITTSDYSINALYGWPKALDYFYPWLEGVNVFDGILFDMNTEDMYTKWNQGNQGLYHVQFAQYKNCVFWSDLGYISDVAKRTNYTLYYSSELPLCYSTIPDNTFKAFYFAYNVTCDPNWSNPTYKESFAKATWATQVFSYYGLHSIGLFDMDSTRFNITLPKDCRGLMFYAPNILNAGVFDAINCTNFGAKSGSWRDAFAYCYQLQNLYIKNLKVNINVSWSPINQQSLEFILSNAANTNKITIYLSPHTYYGLTDANKTLATEKNITLSLISTNTSEDVRLHMLQMTGDGNSYLANDGTYKAITMPEIPSLDNYYNKQEIDNKNFVNSEYVTETLKSKSDTGHTHDDKYYTKAEVDSLLDTIKQMLKDATNKIDGGVINGGSTPTVDSVGEITEDNEILINEGMLSAGTYTLKYLDGNDNVVDNSKPITNFTI